MKICEKNYVNLIIDGIPDPAGKDDDALYRGVNMFISDLVKDDISFDTSCRLDQHKPNHRRPIKLSICPFNYLGQRCSLSFSFT
jgi:hypothetical protein